MPAHTGISPVVSLEAVPWKSLWVTKTAWWLRDMMSWAMQMYLAASSCPAPPIGCTCTKPWSCAGLSGCVSVESTWAVLGGMKVAETHVPALLCGCYLCLRPTLRVLDPQGPQVSQLECTQALHICKVVACWPGNLQAGPMHLAEHFDSLYDTSSDTLNVPRIGPCIRAALAFTTPDTEKAAATMEGLP